MSQFQPLHRTAGSGLSRIAVLGLCAALALTLLAAPAAAQLTGRLAGQVTDADGTPLPGTTVAVNSPNLMGSRTEFTDSDGGFSFPSLPPGVYTIETELEGFIPQQRTEVEVRLNRVTEIHFSMPVGEFGEEVMVVAETPVVDPEQVSTSYNFSTEYLKKASVGSIRRSYQSVLGQAAGVAGGGNPNVYGSTSGENAYYIDGVDSTDPVTATFGVNLTYDAMQDVDFETGGYESKFGRATGGVVNVVTKSGGNQFSGTADVRYRDTDFNTDGEHFDKSQNVTEYRNPAVTLGGPFRRDKLWFFSALNPVRSKSTPTESLLTRDFDGTNIMGKVTWQASPGWQVVGRYINEDATIANSNASRFVAPEAASFQEQPAGISSVEAMALPSSNLQWFVKAGAVRSELNVFPQSRDFDTIGHTDRVTSRSTVNYTNQQFSNRERDDLSTSLTWFTNGAAGDHELQAGVDYAGVFFRSRNDGTGGGYSFSDQNGRPFILNYSPLDPFLEYDADLFTMYLQDTWRVNGNLTVKVGLRNDQIAFTNDAGDEVADMSKLQPRLGLAWDVNGDAKTVVRASWGRSMHPNALTLPSFARARRSPSIRYISCSTFSGSFLGVAPENCAAARPGVRAVGDLTLPNWLADPAGGFDPRGWFFFDALSSEPATIVPGLDPTYADTRLVGIEREFTRRTSIGLTYVEKETSDIFEDTCNGNVQTPTVGADCDFYVMANLPGLARDYSGFILDFESRFADWIHVLASYTRSESKGNVGYTQNAGIAFDIYPDHFQNRYGFMADHRKHRVKVNGYVDLPLDFTMGFVGFWSSPFVHSATEAHEPPSYGLNYVEPRGSREANENYRLDLELRRGFDFGDRVRFELIATAFNVFDQEQVTAVCGRLEGCAGVDFGLATSYRQPQSYEAGIRFEF